MPKRILKDERQLIDLCSVGKATVRDLRTLGVLTVSDLINQNAEKLYNKLCKETGQKHDICVLDVFHAAIYQAEHPKVDNEKCKWWYWSRLRKKNLGGGKR